MTYGNSQTTSITITLNGEPYSLAQSCSIGQLLGQCGYPDTRIAVAINYCVVPRRRFDHLFVNDGDVVDVVQAVGGG